MKRAGFALFVAMVVMVGLSAVANATLIYNGSFELPAPGTSLPTASYTELYSGSTAIDGWTVNGASTTTPVVDWIRGHWEAADGVMSLDLAGRDNGGVFTTASFDTVIGQTYRLRFAMAGNPDGLASQAIKTMVVTIDSVDEFGGVLNTLKQQPYTFDTTGKSRTNMGWEYNDLVFTADAAKTSLKFENGTSYGITNAGAALDDVSVSAIPEPTTLIIWSLLGGLALTMWRRK